MDENTLIVIAKDGSRTPVDEIAGLTIEFRGRNSTIEIGEGAVFHNSKIVIGHKRNQEHDDGFGWEGNRQSSYDRGRRFSREQSICHG